MILPLHFERATTTVLLLLSLFLLLSPLPVHSKETGEAIEAYSNLRVFRRKNLTLLVTWNKTKTKTSNAVQNATGALQTVHISYATTASFVKGTQLGHFQTQNNQATINLPTSDHDATIAVIHFRLTVPPSETFIESSPWISTSQCGDSSHYLNDTIFNGALEDDVAKWTCEICPLNARCTGGRTNTWHNVVAYFGTWRANQVDRGPSKFIECLAKSMCLGAPRDEYKGLYGLDPDSGIDRALVSNSTEGCDKRAHATGPLCSVCVNGTWRDSNFRCIECSDRPLSILFMCLTIIVILVVLVATVAVTILDEETPTAIDLQMVKIMVNHLVISSSTAKLPMQWSPWLQGMFTAFDALSFSFGTGAMSLDCIVAPFAWKDTLVMVALTPVVLVALPMLILLPCSKLWRKRCRIDSKTTAEVAAMVGLLLAHPTITKVTFHLFACRTINENKYLEVDFSIDCDNSDLLTTLRFGLGVPMILIYCIGIPGWYYSRLWRYRGTDFELVRYKYGFLLSGFKPKRYYWELYNTVRKGVFTVTTVIFLPLGPRLQIWATMAVLQGFLAMETWGHPHINPVLNSMEDLALTLDVFQLFTGLGLFFVTDKGINELAEVFSVVILISNLVFIVYWLKIWYKHSEYRRSAQAALVKASKNVSMRRTTKSLSISRDTRKKVIEMQARHPIDRSHGGGGGGGIYPEVFQHRRRPSCRTPLESSEENVQGTLEEGKNERKNGVEVEVEERKMKKIGRGGRGKNRWRKVKMQFNLRRINEKTTTATTEQEQEPESESEPGEDRGDASISSASDVTVEFSSTSAAVNAKKIEKDQEISWQESPL